LSAQLDARVPHALIPAVTGPELVSFVEQLPEIVWHADARGEVDYVNVRFFEVTGVAPRAAFGARWTATLHPDDVARAVRRWRAAVAMGTPFEDEYRLRSQDGTYRWYVVRAAPQRDAGTTTLGWLATWVDIDARKRSEQALLLLLDAGTQLLSALGVREAYETLCDVLVPAHATWVMLAAVDESARATVVSMRHQDRTENALAQTLVGASFNAQDRFGSPIVRGTPEVLSTLPLDWLATSERRMRSVFERFATLSTIGVAIRHGHRVGALLTVGRGVAAGSYSASDVPVFLELARRFSLATAHAQRYDDERRVATSFQRAALPAALPLHERASFDAVYEAGKSEALVGGDWYDAFLLADGRIVLSIGDVSGSGLAAAVTMGLVRQSMRATARVASEPLAILDAADRTLRADDPERIVTAFVAIFDPLTGDLSYAGAGHPPPLVRSPDASVVELAASSVPLGLRRRSQTAGAQVVKLEPGSLVVLYTDGLTEATRDIFEGERRLRDALADPRVLTTAEPAHYLRRAVLRDPSRDDVAILTMRLAAGEKVLAASPGQRWLLTGEDREACVAARHAFARALGNAGISPRRVFSAEVVFGELITSAARRTTAAVEARLEWNERRPVLHVFDDGQHYQPLGPLPAFELEESGLGLVIVRALSEEFNVSSRRGGGNHTRAVLACEAPSPGPSVEAVHGPAR